MAEKKSIENKTCIWCGISFQSTRVQKYPHCSTRCRTKIKSALSPKKLGNRCAVICGPCEHCGDVFTRPLGKGRRPFRVFCGDECDRALRTKSCAHCGNEFEVARENASKGWVCCSPSCRNKARGDFENERTRKAQRRDLLRESGGMTEKQQQHLLGAWKRRGRTCAYCDGACESVDHIVPISRGGTSFEGNLAPACWSCNSSKADLLIVEWRARNGRKAREEQRRTTRK